MVHSSHASDQDVLQYLAVPYQAEVQCFSCHKVQNDQLSRYLLDLSWQKDALKVGHGLGAFKS